MVALRLRFAAAGLCAAGLFASPLAAQGDSDFYKAYYLEHELGDHAAARALYLEVASDRSLGSDVRAEAKRAADALGEDLASSDFARLVPRDAILYAELSRPGEELSMLLESLGLLGTIQEGSGIGISPLLVQSMLGLRGAAVAVTSFHPDAGPSGVLLLHPGDLDVVRGLIETALPAAGTPEPAIGGFPTWSIEGEAYCTLTNRLVVAGTTRSEIEGVLARMRGQGGDSLADNAALADVLRDGGDGLFSFCLNAEPIMPMIQQMLAQEASRDPEAAMMLAFLDVGSLRSVSGYVDVDEEGVSLELAVELAEGHRNLAFNLLRLEPVERATLDRIPSGAAFFLALGLNPEGGAAPIRVDAKGQPVVSFMDFGREIFGNLRDITVYGMPASGSGPLPDIALELGVNDVERSVALWEFALGSASTASGGTGGRTAEIAGRKVRAYDIDGLPIYLSAHANGIVVSPSRSTMERTLSAGLANQSVLDDPVFSSDAARLDEGHTLVAMANPGRCIAFAGGMMDRRDFEEMATYADLLSDTVVSFGLEHTNTRLALHARISSLPDVSGLVAQAMQGGVVRVERDHGVVQVPPGWPAAAALTADAPKPASQSQLRQSFDALVRQGEKRSAEQIGELLFDACQNDADELNAIAWELSTEEPYAGEFVDLCMKMSERSCELTDWSTWYYVDTLALVMFQAGEVHEAVRLEQKAVALAQGDPRASEAIAQLQRFEQELEKVAAGG